MLLQAAKNKMAEFKRQLNFLKEYIFSLKLFILVSSIIFIFAALQGYFTAKNSPSDTAEILAHLYETLGPVAELPASSQFLFITLNNSLIAFLVILFGFALGILSFLVLFSNGFVLGVLAYFSETNFSWSFFLLGILPHGIIEIPAIILACAVGFRLGKTFLFGILKKEGSIKFELKFAFLFFIKILFPLLVLAAAIEVFVTARLL